MEGVLNRKTNLHLGPIAKVLIVLLIGMVIVAISVPNLLRSRSAADQALRYAAQNQAAETTESLPPSVRQVVQTATMSIVAKDVPGAVEDLGALARRMDGWVEESRLTRRDDASFGSVTIRVPSVRLEEARAAIRKLAQRTDDEDFKTNDVTGEAVDLNSTLRNDRAEEQQLLQIMGQARTVKETLEVSQRLSDVRRRIQVMEGRQKSLAQQVDTATLKVNVSAVPVVQALWRPGEQFSSALRDGLQDLADYADSMLAVLLRLPAMLMWVLTIVVALTISWKVGRWYWRRFFAQQA